jgi:potassium-transporting ATPase potassium-binding subunit
MWLFPLLVLLLTVCLSVPLGLYMARIMDDPGCLPGWFRRLEQRIDTGPQTWKQYASALLIFNTLLFVLSYIVLSLQPSLPLNPGDKGMLAPSTIFHTVISFVTNNSQQHYSG